MNNLFQENKNTLLLILGLLFLLLFVFFFLFFRPLSEDLKAEEKNVKQLENDIALLEVEVTNAESTDNVDDKVDTLKLAKKMPLDPELKALILTLEEMEAISESRFDNISFSYDGSIPERFVEEEEETEGADNTADETDDEIADEENNTEIEAPEPEAVINMEEKPEKMHIITISMDVTSPDYEHFQTFVQEIEKQERMMMVSSMDFEKPAESEWILAEEPSEVMSTNVSITTFYYED